MQAYQVPEGSLVESPSRYVVQVAHSLTLEPEMGHKEAENVGNSKAGIPEMIEEVGEVDKSFKSNGWTGCI